MPYDYCATQSSYEVFKLSIKKERSMLNELILHRANQRRQSIDVHQYASMKCKLRHIFLSFLRGACFCLPKDR